MVFDDWFGVEKFGTPIDGIMFFTRDYGSEDVL
jgi:hypothetical protein